jgi:hypothetical protein
MRKEKGPLQTLTHPSVRSSRPNWATSASRATFSFFNRHNPRLKCPVTYSKQKTARCSNRHKFGSSLSLRMYPLSKLEAGNFLTPVACLLYICKVLEETGGPLPASNVPIDRGAGSVGAGIANGFKDSSYISVQILFLKILAGVSLPGIFVSPHFCGRTACPHTEEAA